MSSNITSEQNELIQCGVHMATHWHRQSMGIPDPNPYRIRRAEATILARSESAPAQPESAAKKVFARYESVPFGSDCRYVTAAALTAHNHITTRREHLQANRRMSVHEVARRILESANLE